MIDKINNVKKQALTELSSLRSTAELRNWQIKYLGRKGELAAVMQLVKASSIEQRPRLGKLANELKVDLENAFTQKNISNNKELDEFFDVTLPGIKPARGHYHPITIVQKELEDLFRSMGFMVLDGPELESEYYNFEALNIPSWHPARDIQDTFYIKEKKPISGNRMLLRTHTSSVQVRALEKYGAPLRAVVPGKVFRYEATDASHDNTFWHLEGLVVAEGITVAHLIGVMNELLKGIFKKEVEIRLRPGYFPFVEPGFELDVKCFICGGKGCSVCKQSGWVELMPCGLVHPNVLKAGGVNPEKFSGFAFGLGLSRLVMMKYQIDDIRLFLSGDLRFLEQF
ncbi:MAG: phenylalanine--tRNA ligase subunit alpha [Patescibacteria group bacterium]